MFGADAIDERLVRAQTHQISAKGLKRHIDMIVLVV
jgi:hypothetical protein